MLQWFYLLLLCLWLLLLLLLCISLFSIFVLLLTRKSYWNHLQIFTQIHIYLDLKVCLCILFNFSCFFFSICVHVILHIYLLFFFFLRKSEIIVHYCLVHNVSGCILLTLNRWLINTNLRLQTKCNKKNK